MLWTLPPLAVLALFGGLLNLPPAYGGQEWLGHLLGPLAGPELHPTARQEWGLAGLAVLLFLAGWLVARHRYRRYQRRPEGAIKRFLLAGWRADALVETLLLKPFRWLAFFLWQGSDRSLIDGLLNGLAAGCYGLGERVRQATTGRLSAYLAAFAWGLLLIVGWLFLATVRRGGA
jgi:NADH-quinone oxidoreductase subunit L